MFFRELLILGLIVFTGSFSVGAQYHPGASGLTRDEMIAVGVSVKKETFEHNFEIGINPSRLADYHNEDYYLGSFATVDCVDCPLSGKYSIFATAYRKSSDSVELIVKVWFDKKFKCNLEETVVVSRKSAVTLKRKCGVEFVAKFGEPEIPK